MTTQIKVSATEHGVVRVFALDLAPDAPFYANDLADALGGVALDPAHVDLFAIEDLEGVGLHGYLRDGMGVDPSELAAAQTQLVARTGRIAVIRSAAFSGRAVTLTPRAPLSWIATFGEMPLDLSQSTLHSDAARGVIAGQVPDKPISHRKPLLIVLGALAVIVLATLATLISAVR